MTRRARKRSNPFTIAVLVALIGAALYVQQVVVPATPPLFISTPTPTRSPESFTNEAEQLYQEGKLSGAIDAYKEAISVDPSNVSNYLNLARLQIFTGQYDDAATNAQNALLLNQSNSMSHALLGWAMGFQADYLPAQAELKKALELDPNNAQAHAYLAEVLINNGDATDLPEAAEHSKIARSLDPNLLEVHRARALVLLNSGTENVPEAITELKAAIAINDKIPDLHLNLGYAYKLNEENDLAIEELLAAYALNPSDTTALMEASLTYAKEGQFPKAAQFAEQAVGVDPTNPKLRGQLGIMYYRNQELDKAIKQLGLAVRGGDAGEGIAVEGMPLEYGTVTQYYWFYAFALAKSERCAEAVPVFQSLLVGVPDDEDAVYNANAGIDLCLGIEETPGAPTETPEGEVSAEGPGADEPGDEDAGDAGTTDDGAASPEETPTPAGN